MCVYIYLHIYIYICLCVYVLYILCIMYIFDNNNDNNNNNFKQYISAFILCMPFYHLYINKMLGYCQKHICCFSVITKQ